MEKNLRTHNAFHSVKNKGPLSSHAEIFFLGKNAVNLLILLFRTGERGALMSHYWLPENKKLMKKYTALDYIQGSLPSKYSPTFCFTKVIL